MERIETLIMPPERAGDISRIKISLAKKIGVEISDISFCFVTRRSIDARKTVLINLSVKYGLGNEKPEREIFNPGYLDVTNSPQVVIVGAGPAGYFAALKLITLGVKPLVIERGKPVEERKFDVSALHRDQVLNTESNYAFGEGGAGTYSDGKLYTRSKKKQEILEVLNLFHSFGAPEDILIDAHPHVGTDKLPSIIKKLRETILQYGGEIKFNSCVIDVKLKNGNIDALVLSNGDEISTQTVIWATGHSASEAYLMLQSRNILIEAKAFAMGVRIEHPQELIDQIQYGRRKGNFLPSASYNIACQQQNRGVYSFCMCPGGQIVPALTAPQTRVVNGMSNSLRNSSFANAGLVVEIRPEDFPEKDVLSGLHMQMDLEKQAALNSGSGLKAPAQTISDFASGKISQQLPKTSYSVGTVSSPMHFWLPEHISVRLKLALKYFGRKMPGFLTNEAIMLGVESRTSSPIRIVRDKTSLMSPACNGFFPAGEGAGYAGGIVSSAIDGRLVAEKAAQLVKVNI